MEELVLKEDGKVGIVDSTQVFKEELSNEDVVTEVAGLTAALADLEGYTSRRRQALEDRLQLLQAVQTKFGEK